MADTPASLPPATGKRKSFAPSISKFFPAPKISKGTTEDEARPIEKETATATALTDTEEHSDPTPNEPEPLLEVLPTKKKPLKTPLVTKSEIKKPRRQSLPRKAKKPKQEETEDESDEEIIKLVKREKRKRKLKKLQKKKEKAKEDQTIGEKERIGGKKVKKRRKSRKKEVKKVTLDVEEEEEEEDISNQTLKQISLLCLRTNEKKKTEEIEEGEEVERKEGTEQKVEEKQASKLAPKIQLVDGQIVVNEESLTQTVPAVKMKGVVLRKTGGPLNQNSFRRIRSTNRTRWSAEETRTFYKAIRIFGTNLTNMNIMIKNRSRYQLRDKLRKEEKNNPHLVEFAARNQLELTKEELKELLAGNDITITAEIPMPGEREGNEVQEIEETEKIPQIEDTLPTVTPATPSIQRNIPQIEDTIPSAAPTSPVIPTTTPEPLFSATPNIPRGVTPVARKKGGRRFGPKIPVHNP